MSDKQDGSGSGLDFGHAAVADARFHSLAYAIDEAVVVVDATNVVRFANPAADKLLDGAPGHLIGQPFSLPLPRMKSGRAVLELATGRRLDVSVTLSATVWEGAIAWLATLKLSPSVAEAGTDAVEALLGAMRARFLGHLSHELRTPLNTVLGFSEILMSELYGPLGHAKYRHYSNDIHKAGTRLLGLITDLLDLSRADSGELQLEESLFDLSDVIALLMPEARAGARAADVALETGALQPILLRGDKEKLKRAVLHLVANGLAFTHAPGSVTVSADVGAQGQVLIRVADTGRGFSADELALAFQPFPRVRTVDQADPGAGPGVGLALVRKYVELHGGAVRIESRPGVGTTVTCMLPASRVALDMGPVKQ